MLLIKVTNGRTILSGTLNVDSFDKAANHLGVQVPNQNIPIGQWPIAADKDSEVRKYMTGNTACFLYKLPALVQEQKASA